MRTWPFQVCRRINHSFVTELTNSLAAWSAVANIQFTQVADNGVPFNAGGAAGDIRIGSTFSTVRQTSSRTATIRLRTARPLPATSTSIKRKTGPARLAPD